MLVLPSNNGNPDNGNQGDNLYKVTKMVADETDTLVCSFTDGSLYAWDLFNNTCNYHIDRRWGVNIEHGPFSGGGMGVVGNRVKKEIRTRDEQLQ